MDVSFITDEYKECAVENFADIYFKSIKGYNTLLTSVEFHERFLEYEYILIHQ